MKRLAVAFILAIQSISGAVASGNFAFAVPAEDGLSVEVTGFGQDGAKLFDEQTSTRRDVDGAQSYVVLVDEKVLLASRPAKWCVSVLKGTSPTLSVAGGVCDEQPTEVHGTYTFHASASAPAKAAPGATPTLVASTVTDDFSFFYGSDVADKVKKQVEAGMKEAHAFFLKRLGVTVTIPVAVYVSADPAWLTNAYLQQTGLGEAFRPGKMQSFAGCHGGEAAYGAIFMCLKAEVFSKDWFGSGLAAQRTFALTHEYFHDLQFQLDGDRARHCCSGNDNSLTMLGPQWLVEGSAEYMAFTILRDTKRMNFKQQIAGQLKSAGTVKTPLSGLEAREGYYADPGASWAGLAAVHMLTTKLGFATLPAFWSAMQTGVPWQDAFKTAFGETPEAFYAEYAKAIH